MASNLIDLTEHFTWAEAVHTSHREVKNEITVLRQMDGNPFENIVKTATKLEKVRAILGNHPLIVSSWYRSPALNAAVGGARNSDHMLGAAVDFIAPKFGTPLEVCKKIIENKELIRFKQLILEHTWVHISWEMIPNGNAKLEVLSLLSGGGYARGLTSPDGKALNA